jgi:glycoside/pentoside/hexuronide:cation symporter, GPH family
MMLYTTVNIPYTALLGVTTSNTVERTRLSSTKFVFAFSAGMVISFTLLRLVRWLGGVENPQRGWQLAFIVVGVVAIGFLLITFFGTKERIKPAADPTASARKDIGLLLHNKAWILLTATTLTWILFIAVRSSVSAHYFKYFIFNGSPETMVNFLGTTYNMDSLLSDFNGYGQAGSVVGVLLTGIIASRISKRPLFIALFILQMISTASYFFLSADNLYAIFIIEILGSMVGAPLPVLLWAMYADTADYGEWKTGRRTTGLVFSASTMSQKIGWALAAFFAFKLLEFVGFKANVIPSLAVQNSLVWLMSLLPTACGVLSLLIFLFYPLNDKRVNEINDELKARRLAAGVPASA